jgi:hypothetical protein
LHGGTHLLRDHTEIDLFDQRGPICLSRGHCFAASFAVLPFEPHITDSVP